MGVKITNNVTISGFVKIFVGEPEAQTVFAFEYSLVTPVNLGAATTKVF